ncbi:MAG: divergent polysaccharide deacetylase family protein [Gammaproteobacteria bacterium]|nr:divergent polysaccharide deacetylase family protein [Gammaproteobacteria bacterium]
MRRRWLCLSLFFCAPLWADSPPPPQIKSLTPISIIIDDLGYRYQTSRRTVQSPHPLTCSFLPHTPFARQLAKQAWLLNKDIMVHLPMEAISGKTLGPGGLYQGMDREAFEKTVMENLQAIPHAMGFNNHMGSLLTSNHRAMDWLMQQIAKRHNLFFVDSRTTHNSQALMHANLNGVLNTGRDIFLDHVIDRAAIKKQFQRLIWIAQRHGSALAIGHPHPETLDVLEAELPQLAEKGVKLVPISQLIQYRSERRLAWQQTSLSPLPRAAKN